MIARKEEEGGDGDGGSGNGNDNDNDNDWRDLLLAHQIDDDNIASSSCTGSSSDEDESGMSGDGYSADEDESSEQADNNGSFGDGRLSKPLKDERRRRLRRHKALRTSSREMGAQQPISAAPYTTISSKMPQVLPNNPIVAREATTGDLSDLSASTYNPRTVEAIGPQIARNQQLQDSLSLNKDTQTQYAALPLESYLRFIQALPSFPAESSSTPGNLSVLANDGSASARESGAADSNSLKGFTSFLTTTTKSSSVNNSGISEPSDLDTKIESHESGRPPPNIQEVEPHSRDIGSDTSSIVVLARVQPKAPVTEARNQRRGVDPVDVTKAATPDEESTSGMRASHILVSSKLVADSLSSSHQFESINSSNAIASGGNSTNQGSSGAIVGKGINDNVLRKEGIKERNHSAHEDNALQETKGSGDDRWMQGKKRKRGKMRRDEYDASSQQPHVSENTDGIGAEAPLSPGRMITLDFALRFSNIPRIIIQSRPPFLAVHANAAFCRLTGINAHEIVGKQLASLLSVPDDLPDDLTSSDPVTADSPSFSRDFSDVLSSGPANQTCVSRRGIGRLVVSSGFGRLNSIRVLSKSGHNVNSTQAVEAGGGSSSSKGHNENSPLCSIERRCSIAPVLPSSAMKIDSEVVESDVELLAQPEAKLRRLQEQSARFRQRGSPSNDISANNFRKNLQLQRLITHYVIQLLPTQE